MEKDHRTYDTSQQQDDIEYHLFRIQKLTHGSTTTIQSLEKILSMIMNDCVISNIEAGKNWIFESCSQPEHCQAVLEYMNALAKTTNHFSHRLHLLYLINDIFHHAIRRQLNWMITGFLSRISILLYLIYHCPDATNIQVRQQKVLKVLNIWEEKQFFDSNVIQKLRQEIEHGPSSVSSSQFTSSHTDTDSGYIPIPSQQQQQQQQRKPYYDLPAGLTVVSIKINQPPYTPINPLSVHQRPTHQHKLPSKDMLRAVDDFYTGLKLDDNGPFKTPISKDMAFTLGWENGYLDDFYKTFQSTLPQRMRNVPSQSSSQQNKRSDDDMERNEKQDHRHRNQINRDKSPRRGRSPRRRDRSIERRRSRYYSRSRSRSRSNSRSRSPVRSDYHRHRDHHYSSRRRSTSTERRYRKDSNKLSSSQPYYSKSSLPTSSMLPSSTYSTMSSPSSLSLASTGRMGLGHDSAPVDAFDEFRKRSSYNFNRELGFRDNSAGPKCYNCGNYGHFARNCDGK
ncbi:uncharacterized protein BX664DRAFT_326264 [Halteromyces radiatus]|uniref:uncharacterized protein n=1 Tax=Halteromyces radiatus TaxID=101107 RepID=UPI00221E3973|nr:uncharacterized protein BX664DRAFT_326264 [Halteromyces radiatus]KAI8097391.1 hypothetical protein BX664DRAFT_326264 [Halteromyces radiatus]